MTPVRAGRDAHPVCYGALDLGTNNCRLLIAAPTPGSEPGFRVVEAFSRIVRLGEGLSSTGRLDDGAMDRAVTALATCADKLRRRQVVRVEAVATQACRAAVNGPDFILRVERETGLKLRVIAPREEAELSVAGCAALLDRQAQAALVVDVGGGSTELSWLRLASGSAAPPELVAWLSIPIGVVTLAERFPEPAPADAAWFGSMVEHVRERVAAFTEADGLHPVFKAGDAHMIGTSGAITSLAGLHLGLRRYDRSRVDGLWMSQADCGAATRRLMGLTARDRAREPCIGPDRADLVLAGAAILEAILELWPCHRVRVADRGLREGLLLGLMHAPPPRPRRRRRGRRRPAPSPSAGVSLQSPSETPA